MGKIAKIIKEMGYCTNPDNIIINPIELEKEILDEIGKCVNKNIKSEYSENDNFCDGWNSAREETLNNLKKLRGEK